jgi:hypothetical protein
VTSPKHINVLTQREKKVLISKDMVFDEGIIGLFVLPWKQDLNFDNTIIFCLLYTIQRQAIRIKDQLMSI